VIQPDAAGRAHESDLGDDGADGSGAPAGRLNGVKSAFRTLVPLGLRKSLAATIGRQRRITHRGWWVRELLRDFADADPDQYHRFLWSNHLAYAETYEPSERFTGDLLHPSRRVLFAEMDACLTQLGINPGEVRSTFEVGCSLGFNLLFLERSVFTQASAIEGCDIDSWAIEQGRRHLVDCGSRVILHEFDIGSIDASLDGRKFDVTLCAGVLMYLHEREASTAVACILRHTARLAVFAGLADPRHDNQTLSRSGLRESDGTFIHNLDAMVTQAGWRIARRRWDGASRVGGNSIYFVFATPGDL
jgi:hypothetical protein